MNTSIVLVTFLLYEQRYALPLPAVLRVVAAAEVTRLPGAPPIVIGAINLQGEVIPVLNMRRRLSLPEREIGPNDQFIIARIRRRAVALVIDEVQAITEHEQSAVISPDLIVPGLEHVQGVIRLDDGLLLIQNLEKFLSLDEVRMLDEAMDRTD